MRRSFPGVAALLLAASAHAQQSCPNPAFQNEVAVTPGFSMTRILLVRESDRTYSALEMTQDTPARLVRVVPNYGKQFAA